MELNIVLTIVKSLSLVSYLVRLLNSHILWKQHCDKILPLFNSEKPKLNLILVEKSVQQNQKYKLKFLLVLKQLV